MSETLSAVSGSQFTYHSSSLRGLEFMSKAIHALNLLRFAAGSCRPIIGPAKVAWDITYRCNLRCQHCHLWQVKDHDDLTTEEGKAFIRGMAEVGTAHLSFSGGEPFLRDDIFELVSYAREQGLTTAVNTNGTKLQTPAQAKEVWRAGMGTVFVSLDSSEPEVHNQLRGSDKAFDLAIRAIANLLDQRGGKTSKVFINTTVNRSNIDKLESIVELAQRMGLDGMTMSVIQDVGKYSPEGHTSIGKDKRLDLPARLRALARQSGGLIPHSDEYLDNFETYLDNPDCLYKYRCVAGYATALVHPNGDVFPCPVAFARMGSLRESSFKDLWYSEEADKVRERIRRNQHPICWFDCIAPLSVFLYNMRRGRLDRMLHKNTIAHMLDKVAR